MKNEYIEKNRFLKLNIEYEDVKRDPEHEKKLINYWNNFTKNVNTVMKTEKKKIKKKINYLK